jgi:hypothetical protein
MLRVPLAKAHIKRTIRPLYGWTQSTPKSQFLDPAWDGSVPIFPGMAMMKTAGEGITLLNGTGDPYGLSAFYEGGEGIFEISEQGVNACAVWVLADDAEFEVMDPAFDPTVSWTEPLDGTLKLVHAYVSGAKRGRLCPEGTAGASAKPVAKLVKVNSPTKITIGGLSPTDLG